MNDDLISSVNNIINLANISSLIYKYIERTSWAGFYLSDKKCENLFLQCFQGDPVCIQIPFGRGVCGKSAIMKETIVCDNVLEFPGHIACSSLSRSEIVVPIIKDDKVVDVLDLDSEEYNNFNSKHVEILEEICRIISRLF